MATKQTKGKLNKIKSLQDDGKRAEALASFFETPFSTFGQTLRYLRKDMGFSQAVLAEKAGLSDRAIGTYERNEYDYIQKSTVLALCIALNLLPEVAEFLLLKAGFFWTDTKEDIFYRNLIWHHYDEDLDTWNSRLKKAGIMQKLPNNKKFKNQ